jgi:lipoprotein-releasing system permease protein
VQITHIIVYLVVMLSIAVLLNIGGWWATVRIFDALGRRLRFHQFVAVRHLRGRKSGFLTAIGILAILGVSFSSCTLTTVLSVMGGFSNDLKQKILATNAHVVVDNFGGDLAGAPDASGAIEHDWRELLERVRRVPGVAAATPVVQGEAMMNARTNNHGIQLKGIEPASYTAVSRVLDERDKGEVAHIERPELLFEEVRQRRLRLYGGDSPDDRAPDAGTATDAGPAPADAVAAEPAAAGSPRQRVLPTVFVGRELAKSLRLYVGEEVNIIAPLGDIGPAGPIPKSRPFRVAGVFFSGMYEFDSLYVYAARGEVQRFLRKGDRISEVQVAVADPDRADEVAGRISAELGGRLRIRPWQELNASLFSALKLEKIVMFIFLSLAILVASFCIIATLSMLVIEKTGEISVLMTLGAGTRAVMRIFRFEGLLIGLVGTVSGLLVGFGLSASLEHIGLPIDPEVWYIDRLPVMISPLEFALVGAAALITTQLATLFATHIAAKPNPVEGLKNG